MATKERDDIPAEDSGELGRRALRDAFGRFATGVCIVATEVDGELIGATFNSFSSVSLDPPLVLVCVGKELRSHDAFVRAKGFAISVLGRKQAEMSGRFASRGAQKWKDTEYRFGAQGGLIIEPNLAWFDCAAYSGYDCGDHTLLLGKVINFGAGQCSTPLVYFRGAYDGVASEVLRNTK